MVEVPEVFNNTSESVVSDNAIVKAHYGNSCDPRVTRAQALAQL